MYRHILYRAFLLGFCVAFLERSSFVTFFFRLTMVELELQNERAKRGEA